MIAQALGHLACRRGYNVTFTKASRLLADLAGGHADRTWEARLRRWARPAVLIVDDFAMRSFTPTPIRRPLRARHRKGGQESHHDSEPSGNRLVLAVSKCRCRRVDSRSGRQQRPSHSHGRKVVPTQHAPRCDQRASRERAGRSAQGVCRSRVPRAASRHRAAGAGAASTAHRGAGASASPERLPSGSKSTTTATPITGGRPAGCGSSECAGATPRWSSQPSLDGPQPTIWPIRSHELIGGRQRAQGGCDGVERITGAQWWIT